MRAQSLVVVLFSAATLVVASGATAKDFAPGDLRICSGQRCVPITNRPIVKVLSAFYYRLPDGRKLATTPAAHPGAPAFELRFRNGYVTGIVATAKLDRFLSYGVNLGQFARGQWYRVPDGAARELRRLAASLRPLRVTRVSLARSR
jgi:hypothetical protein